MLNENSELLIKKIVDRAPHNAQTCVSDAEREQDDARRKKLRVYRRTNFYIGHIAVRPKKALRR